MVKQLNKIFIVALALAGFTAQAQDRNNPWTASFGLNAIDTRGSAGDNVFDQFFKVDQNWNIRPSGPYLRVDRALTNSFAIGLGGSMHRIEKYVFETPDGSGNFVTSNPGELRFYSLDASLKFSLMKTLNSKWLDPYFNVGEGYTWFGPESYFVTRGGAGFNFWINKTVGINLGTAYNYSFGDRDNAAGTAPNQPGYWQHFAGLTLKFGAKDTDKDGIPDYMDDCPELAGSKQFNGCPDTDGDGIIDKNDKCPDVAGKPEFNGCPDTDGDGIMDSEDACPTVAGSMEMKGCPDSDKDGVADNEDKCPNVLGPKENGGCPWPDTDKDGVADKDDKCPEQPGTVANNGCPELTPNIQKALGDYAKTILFKSGTSIFESRTQSVLDNIVNLMNEYPDSKFRIEGHTDNTGNPKKNMELSKNRAAAVEKYLTDHGIAKSRLSSEGYGQNNPIDTNETVHGRSNNRRVEVKLVK